MSSPFNEAKYKALLEGLEASEISYRYVKKSNDIFRFDSNYFQKEFITTESLIRVKAFKTLKVVGVELKSFGAYSLNNDVTYMNSGVPFVRGVNMKKGRIVFTDMIYIDEIANSLLWKSEVKPEMVLLSMSGTIGDVALASKKWKYPINSNQDIAKINTKGKINPYFLFAFLLSKFGQNYLKREARGSVQQHVFLSQMELFEIPTLGPTLCQRIEQLILESDDKLFLSEELYKKAEFILLETLGLKDFQPSSDPINVKYFKESFLTTGRLDAEYFQLKYEDYLMLIQSYSNGFGLLSSVCNLKDNNFNPEDNILYKYIELANIGKTGDVTGLTIAKGIELPSRARRIVRRDDVIISSIEGSLDRCALVTDEYENALCSTGFYIINSKHLNSETLLVLFKSEPLQNILKQNCSGTILTSINKTEFQNIPLPLVKTDLQKKIKDMISDSFKFKKQSELLLETAK